MGLYWQCAAGRSRRPADKPQFALRDWNGNAALARRRDNRRIKLPIMLLAVGGRILGLDWPLASACGIERRAFERQPGVLLGQRRATSTK